MLIFGFALLAWASRMRLCKAGASLDGGPREQLLCHLLVNLNGTMDAEAIVR